MFVLKERDNPVKSLDRGVFQRNKRRNCAGFLVILVITALVMILFIQAKNTGRTITEKAFQKTGTDAQAIFGYISEKKSVPFYLGAIPVLTAGHWLLMEILRKSAVKDRPLYRQLLSLGMTKTQWSRMLQGQVDRLCLAAIPAGLLTGAWTGSILAGY